eukprot:14334676-Alexandrium_andersonii.AAC.1
MQWVQGLAQHAERVVANSIGHAKSCDVAKGLLGHVRYDMLGWTLQVACAQGACQGGAGGGRQVGQTVRHSSS